MVSSKNRSNVRFPPSLMSSMGLLWDGWDNKDLLQKLWLEERQADIERLSILCSERQIAQGEHMYFELALQLAREAYPEPKKAGRKVVWNDLTLGVLVVEIERRLGRREQKKSVTWACKQLSKQERWLNILSERNGSADFASDPAEALRKAYHSFKNKPMANVMRKAYQLHVYEGTETSWDELTLDILRNPLPAK